MTQIGGDYVGVAQHFFRGSLRNFGAVVQADRAVSEFAEKTNFVVDYAQGGAVQSKVA